MGRPRKLPAARRRWSGETGLAGRQGRAHQVKKGRGRCRDAALKSVEAGLPTQGLRGAGQAKVSEAAQEAANATQEIARER